MDSFFPTYYNMASSIASSGDHLLAQTTSHGNILRSRGPYWVTLGINITPLNSLNKAK